MANTHNAELAQLEAKNREYEANFRSGDYRAMVERFYSPEIRMIVPDMPVIEGREPLIQLIQQLGASYCEVRLLPKETRFGPAGDVAWQVANSVLVPRDGAKEVECRYVVIWKKTGDEWFCEADFFAYGFL